MNAAKRIPLVAMLVLAACTAIQPQNRVRIADNIDLQLQAPAGNSTVLQKIDATYRAQQHTLLMQVETHDGTLAMAGLTPTGTRLFSLSFDGATISSWQSPLFTAPFDGAYVLADYQLASLPVASLQRALPATASLREETTANGERQRQLLDHHSTVVVEIRYQRDGSVQYCHRQRDYCLLITPLNAR
jgi:hypothetical protein